MRNRPNDRQRRSSERGPLLKPGAAAGSLPVMIKDTHSPGRSNFAEFWDAWAFAAVEAELACAAWRRAARELKATAFAAYRSALDREEAAAAQLAARLSA
jgi:hypothetical protein